MKNYFKYIAILALGVVSCEPELENSIEDGNVYSNGQADFSNYVALGNSLTAGYADGALYIAGQENAYPNILAEKFSMVQETEEFTIPYVNDNNGGLLFGGNQIAETRFVLAVGANGPSPVRLNAQPTTEVTNMLEGPFSNMGVPGAKSYHLIAPGYGSMEGIATGMSNPYFTRFATTTTTTVLADALMQQPTFFSLWIGNNDVLGYATSGGVGVFQMDNTDVASYGPNDITDPNAFAFVYNQLVEQLSANADGVLLNIPNVTNIPYFNTIPNNALALDAATAQNLTGFFQAVAGVMTQVLMQQGASQEQAQAIASQYAIQFSEGANRFLIDVPVTQTNPLGFRQMTEEELLLLPIDRSALAQGYGSVVLTADVQEVLAVLQAGGQPTQEQVQTLFGAVSGIDDKDALDSEEIQNIEIATTAYNNAISVIAQNYDLALIDVNEVLSRVSQPGGTEYQGVPVSSVFVRGGVFSLDGIHLTPRGNAIIANEIILEINSKYGANIPRVDIGSYGTITLEGNVL